MGLLLTSYPRRIMPIEEPAPADDAAVIIVHDPLEALGVAVDEGVQLGFVTVGEFEFCLREYVSASVIKMRERVEWRRRCPQS